MTPDTLPRLMWLISSLLIPAHCTLPFQLIITLGVPTLPPPLALMLIITPVVSASSDQACAYTGPTQSYVDCHNIINNLHSSHCSVLYLNPSLTILTTYHPFLNFITHFSQLFSGLTTHFLPCISDRSYLQLHLLKPTSDHNHLKRAQTMIYAVISALGMFF